MKQNILIVLLVIASGGIGFYLQFINNKPAQVEFSKENYMPKLHNLHMPILGGGMKKLTDWKGKIIVLNFWATWCPPCLKELPLFASLQEKWRDKNVQFVGFSLDDPEKVARFAKKTNMNYPNLLGTAFHLNMSINMGNKIKNLPFTVVIDPDFNVVGSIVGEASESQLYALAQPLWDK